MTSSVTYRIDLYEPDIDLVLSKYRDVDVDDDASVCHRRCCRIALRTRRRDKVI